MRDLDAAWRNAYALHVAAQAAAEAAASANTAARAACEKEVRRLTRIVQGSSDTTIARRAEMGVALRRTGPGTPAPVPASRPLALVDGGARLTHQLRLVDESTPTRRARRRGLQCAEVFVVLTPPGQPAPSDPREHRSIGSVTRGETTLSVESDKGGMQSHSLSRCVSTSGAGGPWSDTASATVAA